MLKAGRANVTQNLQTPELAEAGTQGGAQLLGVPRDSDAPSSGRLAPLPDFRYVELGAPRIEPNWFRPTCVAALVLFAMLTSRGTVSHAVGAAAAVFLGVLLVEALIAARGFSRGGEPLVIVPWGVVVGSDARSRVLRWAAVDAVDVDRKLGGDQGTPLVVLTRVRISSRHEAFVGAARGDVGLDVLAANLGAIRGESSREIAVDLERRGFALCQTEPVAASLLAAAKSYVHSSDARLLLDVDSDYRARAGGHASRRTQEVLRRALQDEVADGPDIRPFAIVLAAEWGIVGLVESILALTQSPNPIVAAVARAGAKKLGASDSRAGSVDEVAAFLHEADRDRLVSWICE
jgi:hypothetical protein